jgi:dATP pyrophosphohydrolase
MARAPFQVVVFPFRRAGDAIEYAIFRRADDEAWQGIAGGGEEGETPAQAARREAAEEAAIDPTAPLYALESHGTVPRTCIAEAQRRHWPPGLLVLPNHAFAIDCTGIELRLSAEHTEVAWTDQATALRRLRWDSDRTALWELGERLATRAMPGRA